MSGAMSRRKGAASELEFCRLLHAHGWSHAARTSDGRAQQGRGDIQRGPAGIHLELKRRERIEIVRWCQDTELDAASTDIPVVAFRQSHQPWRMVMLAEDLLPILKLRETG